MRPIVDFTRSPLHKLSGYLHQLLAPLVGTGPTQVRNSSDFIEKVRHISLDDSDIMVSFDVVSLFTCVPTDLAVKVCQDALSQDPSLPERCPIELPDLARLLQFCLTNTYFTFGQVHYRQVRGTAMGASVSVTAANLTMESLERCALASFVPAPKVFLRYVDDCFCIIRKDVLPQFTTHLNCMNEAIQFTVEEENNGQLPFLDVLVKRAGPGLEFDVYRKSTHTGRYLHFRSVQPASHKRSVVSSLIRRSHTVCTRPEDVANDVRRVRQDLSSCGYPDAFVSSVERRMALQTTPSTGKKKWAAIPYVPGTSEALARVLRSYDVHVAHVPSKRLRHTLTHVKDKLPKERFPGVIYEVPCANCNSVYVGETGCFQKRLKQHCYDVKTKKVTSNALAEHAELSGHEIDWENARIITKEKNLAARLNLESLIIQTTPNTLNRNIGTLHPMYARCLRHVLKPT